MGHELPAYALTVVFRNKKVKILPLSKPCEAISFFLILIVKGGPMKKIILLGIISYTIYRLTATPVETTIYGVTCGHETVDWREEIYGETEAQQKCVGRRDAPYRGVVKKKIVVDSPD